MPDEQNNNFSIPPEIEDEIELHHSDKLVGIFTEPIKTFSKMANEKTKTFDWLIPVVFLIIITNVALMVLMTNPNIKYAFQEKQIANIQQQFDEAVKKGQMSKEQADQQVETIRERMDQTGAAAQVIQLVSSAIGIFIVFFIVSGVYFLFAKFLLKGDGTYNHAMTAYGLPFYIAVIQWIIIVIFGLVSERMIMDTSVGSFMNIDKSSLGGFLLSKADIFSIWFYWLVAVGLAKLFKSENLNKYVITVFSLWIGFNLLFFFLSQSIPFLKPFLGM